MRLLVSPEARREFEAAERYYEMQMPGLGVGLRGEVAPHCDACEAGRWLSRLSAVEFDVLL